MQTLAEVLSDWLASTGQKVEFLALHCGVHPTTVLRWKNGQRQPRATQLAALNLATSGYMARHGHGTLLGPAVRPEPIPRARPGFADAQAPFATEARAMGLDPDAIAAKAIRDAIRAEKERRWLEDNRDAIAAHNEWVEKHGVPLAKYRMF